MRHAARRQHLDEARDLVALGGIAVEVVVDAALVGDEVAELAARAGIGRRKLPT